MLPYIPETEVHRPVASLLSDINKILTVTRFVRNSVTLTINGPYKAHMVLFIHDNYDVVI